MLEHVHSPERNDLIGRKQKKCELMDYSRLRKKRKKTKEENSEEDAWNTSDNKNYP
jgi:hypothetical protein